MLRILTIIILVNCVLNVQAFNENTHSASCKYFMLSDVYHNLGVCFLYGKCGRPVDYVKAEENFLKAADLGCIPSQFNLGLMYRKGLSGEGVNYTKALEYFGKAAEKKDRDALYQLGTIYAYGEGVHLNLVTAASYFMEASSRGNKLAKLALSLMYRDGRGVPRDPDKAMALEQELQLMDEANKL